MTDTITLPRSVVAGALHALDLSQALLEFSKSVHHTTILEEYKALRAAIAQQAEQEWQPIETAPKETEIFIGRFIDGKFKFGRSEMFYEKANEFAGETFSGWVWSEDECSSSITDSPTHWMSLPAAPKEAIK